ncbi:MAG: hypothetical protein IJY14_04030 [Acholeplasmatales bacterium]|nr:hypothetical protein [Acholeplasmatales bacterium]
MLGLGLGVSIFIFITATIMLLGYIIAGIFKKYHFANNILPLAFLHILFALMIESWALIIMNGGFDIILDLNIDYSIVLILIIPIFIFVEIINYQAKKVVYDSGSIIKKVYRYLLPTFMVIAYTIALGVFYFSCHYFSFLSSI